MKGVERILIGSSRRAHTPHHQGSFQRRIESLLPPEIHVQVPERDDEATRTGMPVQTTTRPYFEFEE